MSIETDANADLEERLNEREVAALKLLQRIYNLAGGETDRLVYTPALAGIDAGEWPANFDAEQLAGRYKEVLEDGIEELALLFPDLGYLWIAGAINFHETAVSLRPAGKFWVEEMSGGLRRYVDDHPEILADIISVEVQ